MEDLEGQKKEVFIITGFLGAGKTTTLNHLLKKFSPETTVIIENEFGKVNIDTSLINQQYKQQVFELTNGCICCSLDEDLYDVLTEISLNRTAIKHVFIETTGIADAGNIAAIFKRTEVQQAFQLQTIICVVDAESIEDYLENTLETQRQLITSDVILLNKYHLVSEAYSMKMEAMLKEINPFARVIRLIEDIPMKRSKTDERSLVSDLSIPKASSGKLSHRINSVLYESDVVFDFQHLCYTLNTTLFFYYHQVFRIKGFVKCINHAEETPSVNIYEVQSTGKSLHVTISEKKDFLLNQLVFIGRQLKTDTITRLFRQ